MNAIEIREIINCAETKILALRSENYKLKVINTELCNAFKKVLSLYPDTHLHAPEWDNARAIFAKISQEVI